MEGTKLDDQLYVEWHGPHRCVCPCTFLRIICLTIMSVPLFGIYYCADSRLGARYIPNNYVDHVGIRSTAEEPCHDRFGHPQLDAHRRLHRGPRHRHHDLVLFPPPTKQLFRSLQSRVGTDQNRHPEQGEPSFHQIR